MNEDLPYYVVSFNSDTCELHVYNPNESQINTYALINIIPSSSLVKCVSRDGRWICLTTIVIKQDFWTVCHYS